MLSVVDTTELVLGTDVVFVVVVVGCCVVVATAPDVVAEPGTSKLIIRLILNCRTNDSVIFNC